MVRALSALLGWMALAALVAPGPDAAPVGTALEEPAGSAEVAPSAPPADAGDAEARQPAGILIKDRRRGVELRLPAAYWQYYDPERLASENRGCAGRRVPPHLVFILRHKDAPATVWCESTPRTFLMRNKDDLETFVNAFVDTIRAQVGEDISDVSASYERRDGAIVHGFQFSASVSGPPGCNASRPQAPKGPRMHYLFTHIFVRPKDSDAFAYKVFCTAPEAAYKELRPEFDFIVANVRYSGETAEQFFVPDAPEEKVLSAEDAAKMASPRKSSYAWLLLIVLAIIVWRMMRKKKERPA